MSIGPIQDIVEYETKIFTTGLDFDPEFSLYAAEPSDEVDELWTGLYPSMSKFVEFKRMPM